MRVVLDTDILIGGLVGFENVAWFNGGLCDDARLEKLRHLEHRPAGPGAGTTDQES